MESLVLIGQPLTLRDVDAVARGGAAVSVSPLVLARLYAALHAQVTMLDGDRPPGPDIETAARGMGMGGAQVLWRVEVPLALPVIVAGLRIAAVTVISVSVVAAYVGAAGWDPKHAVFCAPQ